MLMCMETDQWLESTVKELGVGLCESTERGFKRFTV